MEPRSEQRARVLPRGIERGAGMLEYALLTSLIAIALVVAFQAFGSGVSTSLSSTVQAFN